MPPRLKRALSFSALAGLVLLGDIAHRLSIEAEEAMEASDTARGAKPRGRSKGTSMVPWIISCVSVAALIIVIVTR